MKTLKTPKGGRSWRQEAEALSKDTMARLRWKVLCRFGMLPNSRQAKTLRDKDVLLCALHMFLDGQEQQARLCPSCRDTLEECLCPSCGRPVGEENPAFDPQRFEEMKHRG